MKNTNEKLQEQVGLVRAVEAALSVAHPNENDLKFFASLLNRASAELQEMPLSLVLRMHTAVCAVEFAPDSVVQFRLSLQTVLGRHYNLRAYRTAAPVARKEAA